MSPVDERRGRGWPPGRRPPLSSAGCHPSHATSSSTLIQDAAYGVRCSKTTRQRITARSPALEARRDDATSTPSDCWLSTTPRRDFSRRLFPTGRAPASRPCGARQMWKRSAISPRGLEVLRTLPGTAEHPRRELALQVALGVPLRAAERFADPAVRARVRAHELCREESDTVELFSILRGLWEFHELRGRVQDRAGSRAAVAHPGRARGGSRRSPRRRTELMGDTHLRIRRLRRDARAHGPCVHALRHRTA